MPAGWGSAAASTAARTRSAAASASSAVGVRKRDQQLLAAEPEGHVLAAQAAADRDGDRPQRLIAGEVAELIVVDLESVDVAQRDRERLAARLVSGLEPRQLVRERSAVAHAGERVTAGVLPEPLVEPRQFGLAVGEIRQRQTLAIQHPAQAALEQGAAHDQRGPAEPESRVQDERDRVGRVLEARAEQRPQEHEEQPRGEDPAPQPRLLGSDRRLGPAGGKCPADADRHEPQHPDWIEHAVARDIALVEQLLAPGDERCRLEHHPGEHHARCRGPHGGERAADQRLERQHCRRHVQSGVDES